MSVSSYQSWLLLNPIFRQAQSAGFPSPLIELCQSLLLHSLAINTQKSYWSNWNSWLNFCQLYKQDPLVISEPILAMYIAHEFSIRHMAVSTIEKRLSAIKSIFNSTFSSSQTLLSYEKYYTMKRILKGALRIQGGPSIDHRLPVTIDHLARFFRILDVRFPSPTLEILTTRAMFSVALFGLLRSSEYIAKWGDSCFVFFLFKGHSSLFCFSKQASLHKSSSA